MWRIGDFPRSWQTGYLAFPVPVPSVKIISCVLSFLSIGCLGRTGRKLTFQMQVDAKVALHRSHPTCLVLMMRQDAPPYLQDAP